MSLHAIVIGASAGGVHALLQVLPALPDDFPAAILVVVHVPPRRDNALVGLLAEKCQMIVKEAEDKEPIVPGTIYMGPPDYHLLVESDGTIALSSDEVVNYSRPAIDVLFESAADAFGERLAGVIMTGANHDGSKGLRAVCNAGGHAIVQTPASAEVAYMPEAALAACPAARTVELEDIPSALEEMMDR